MSDAVPVFAEPSPRVRRVSVDRAWAWLAAGWGDIMETPRVSLALGLSIAVVSVVLTAAVSIGGFFYLLLPLAAGFFLVAPLLAVGFYEISRRNDEGLSVTLNDALTAWRRNQSQIALMGLVLMLMHLAWVRIATLLFALFFRGVTPSLDRLVDTVFFSPISLPFLLTGTIIGAALAVTTFAISAVAVPMLLDREVSVFTAIATSCMVVRVNWRAMTLWAALIVVFTSMGLATFYAGLVIAIPVLGHASWHAYRDLVE